MNLVSVLWVWNWNMYRPMSVVLSGNRSAITVMG